MAEQDNAPVDFSMYFVGQIDPARTAELLATSAIILDELGRVGLSGIALSVKVSGESLPMPEPVFEKPTYIKELPVEPETLRGNLLALGDRVRRHREAAGLSLASVARDVGIGQTTLSRLEGGNLKGDKLVRPKGHSLLRIAERLGMDRVSVLEAAGYEIQETVDE